MVHGEVEVSAILMLNIWGEHVHIVGMVVGSASWSVLDNVVSTAAEEDACLACCS